MATMRGSDTNLVHLLSGLISIDFDAIEAYEAAIERLNSPEDRDQFRFFMHDHVRHTRELASVVRQLGGSPPAGGDFKRMLTKGKVLLAALVDDRAVLLAMKSNESDTNLAYERAVRHPELTTEIRRLLEENLGDERRHKAWIEARLEAIGRSSQTHA